MKTKIEMNIKKLQELSLEMDRLITEGRWNREAYERLSREAIVASAGDNEMLSFLRLKAEPQWLGWPKMVMDPEKINRVAYNFTTQILEVELFAGDTYRCYLVPPEKYQELLTTSSQTTYFNQHIRGGAYSCFQVPDHHKE